MRFHFESLAHESDDVRLRNGQPVADRQRTIAVRLGYKVGRYELTSRDGLHGIEHPHIRDVPLLDLLLNHPLLCRLRVELRSRKYYEAPQLRDVHSVAEVGNR